MDKSSNMPPAKSRLTETHISLAHGNGGRFMRELIDNFFAYYLHNKILDTQADSSLLPSINSNLFITTDGFSVQPLEFPGGNIGTLAIHGTINDLAVAGAIPHYLTLTAFLEEGLEINTLERIIQSLAAAAQAAKVVVVAGDTKVVPRGQGGGIYFSITGIDSRDPKLNLSMQQIRPGDCILVSGTVGDHGAAVMLAREDFGLSGELQSDCASVLPLVPVLSGLYGIRFLRDPTRGGLATVAHEIATATGYQVKLTESQIPVHESVRSICEMLGYDPLYLASEKEYWKNWKTTLCREFAEIRYFFNLSFHCLV